ncbi:hypothetical protein JY97_12615 [Alkalispirochaeta odontotermitis]|nr:hypothetical protein JY97_12615 [Alkalispirochaeta odontotermitis]CAB1068990.1 hypothetical protein D1AOALGA4SA_512 [Olavius algarvensis Delta 1 endosymbiont]
MQPACGPLYNDNTEDIRAKHSITERPAGIKARDRLAQALYVEIFRHGNCVWLDLRDVSDRSPMSLAWSSDYWNCVLRRSRLKLFYRRPCAVKKAGAPISARITRPRMTKIGADTFRCGNRQMVN